MEIYALTEFHEAMTKTNLRRNMELPFDLLEVVLF